MRSNLRVLLTMVALSFCSAAGLFAADVTGLWQGTYSITAAYPAACNNQTTYTYTGPIWLALGQDGADVWAEGNWGGSKYVADCHVNDAPPTDLWLEGTTDGTNFVLTLHDEGDPKQFAGTVSGTTITGTVTSALVKGTFKLTRGNSGGCGAPNLIAPAPNANGIESPVTLQWSAVSGSDFYIVWAKTPDDDTFIEIGETEDTTLSTDVPPGSIVEWYVVAASGSCAAESAHATFTTAGCGYDGAVPLSPPNGATGVSSPVTFTWSAYPKATGYRIWAARDGGDYDVIDETTTTTTTDALPPGQYLWFVETFFADCDSAYSDDNAFTIPRAANCPTVGAKLASPAEGSTVTGHVTFTWSPVAGAVGYEVYAALDDGDYEWLGETTSTSLVADLGAGKISWIVSAELNGCDDLDSAIGTFTVPYDPACDHASTFLISPADGDSGVPLKVDFIWTPVDGATGYNVWIRYPAQQPQIIGSTKASRLTATLPQQGEIEWYTETTFASCSSDFAPSNVFTASANAACTAPGAPDVYVDPQAMSGEQYYLIFSPGLNTASYEVQESTTPSFSAAVTTKSTDILVPFTHTVASPTRFYYRVRSVSSCGLGTGAFSSAASIVISPATAADTESAEAAASYGAQGLIVQKVHIPGSGTANAKTGVLATFTVTADKPWMTVTPSSGTIPPEGIDLTITSDPKQLPAGTSTGTLKFTSTASATTPPSVPVSVNLVTPVTPNAGTSPLPTSLFVPAVVHAAGIGASFESDVRVANVSPQTMKYLLSFTPTLSDGTRSGQQATVQIDPGDTVALNDILKNFYGFAAAGDNVSGVLEVRPITNATTTPLGVTLASSRTFASGTAGTYGQYIPAIPFSQFIAKSKDPNVQTVLSLQQIAQSSSYRTNFGLVEGAGEAATVQVTVFNDAGQKLGSFPISLRPAEHMQIGQILAANGLTNVTDGRIEVAVTSATGKVTAYASVLDNKTQDPLLVFPVNTSSLPAGRRYILPGVADLNTGTSNWRSDIRIFNAGTTPASATLTYYPQGGNPGANAPATMTIAPGEVKAIDGALQSLFGVGNSGGSILVTTPNDSRLVATARTYNLTSNGTYGQFIPGLAPGDGVGLNERAAQILQVEESDRFRTNLGIVELTGNPVTVEISAFVPDSKVTAKTQITLGPNEFRQIGGILHQLGLGTTYNARIAMRVVGGTGRISGYGSLIDNRTQDPTYVPAQ